MKFNFILLFLILSNINYAQALKNDLNKYSAKQLYDDFDLCVNSIKEANTGLYWYNTYAGFDSLVKQQRAKIHDSLTSKDFFAILAPVVVGTKQGHCRIFQSDETDNYLQEHGKYIPIFLSFFDNKPYIINDYDVYSLKGKILLSINSKSIDSIITQLFKTIWSDGYIVTKKYKAIDGQDFSYCYNDIFDKADSFVIKTLDPTNQKISYHTLHAVNGKWLDDEWEKIRRPQKSYELSFDEYTHTAFITFNTFKRTSYKDFHKTVDSIFQIVLSRNIKNIVLDLRKNGGGEEGYEDYVFSYLTDKPYTKYKYVQLSAFNFSFYQYTNYKTDSLKNKFEEQLRDEHELESDGRILRKQNVLVPEKPKTNAFRGKLYVLISGATYSGASELASIIKGNSQAIFIGEETGGGFYGNTSGLQIELALPNTKLYIQIPLLNFVVNVKSNSIPFGRGVIPDYFVTPKYSDYKNNMDTEINFVKGIIKK